MTTVESIVYPAEWEKQAATWLAWPSHPDNWGGARKAAIEDFYTTLIATISRFQTVCVLVPYHWKPPAPVAGRFLNLRHIPQFFEIPTNDIWIRDYGPFFIRHNKALAMVKFEFNAWGGKFPPWTQDNAVPVLLSRALGTALYRYSPILEGGAIECNGDGIALTTAPCLFGRTRNRDSRLVERTIMGALGLRSLLVLPNGIPGDHTDGHIDNVARFVGKSRVVMSDGYPGFDENRQLIEAELKKYYDSVQIDTLPLPPQRQLGKEVLPASYANFIFVNGGLIVPLYNCAQDAVAMDYFKSVFPEREVMGLDCSLVIEEGGSLHCLSKQQPG
jgi:agmatine deiminase